MNIYKQQTYAFTLYINAKNHIGNKKLSLFKIIILVNILKTFVKDLLDNNIQRDKI